jgi:hypothetical protein
MDATTTVIELMADLKKLKRQIRIAERSIPRRHQPRGIF